MLVIGELINGMYKNVRQAIQEKDTQTIKKLAKEQVARGADALDVNCGPLSKDPVADMRWLVETIQCEVDVPLALDSSKPAVIEAGLGLVAHKAIINSTTADEEKLNTLLPLAVKYKSSLIALAISKKGIPQDKEQRIELAAGIITACQEKGFPLEELYIDPVVMPVNVAQAQGGHILEALREFKLLSDPAVKTVVGLSNVSQGTKERGLINRTFLVMALGAGLDAAILDPFDKELMDATVTAEIILNRHIYCDSFLDTCRK